MMVEFGYICMFVDNKECPYKPQPKQRRYHVEEAFLRVDEDYAR